MADPLSVSASIVGVVVPAMHAIRLLVDDLKQLKEAPDNLKGLKGDICSVEAAIESIQAIQNVEWNALGPIVSNNIKSTIDKVSTACLTFRADLLRWTRHSQGSFLSWRDRSTVGFWKQSHVKSMKGQLQNCQVTVANVVSIAILYSSIRHAHMTEKIRANVAARQDEISTAIRTIDSQSAGVSRMIQDADSPDMMQDEERSDAADQLRRQKEALSSSQMLLKELLSKIQEPAISRAMQQAGSVYNNSFRGVNHGQQIGVSNGVIHFSAK